MGQPAWRADGKVLLKTPNQPEFPRPVNPWGKVPLVHMQVHFTNIPSNASTTVEPTGHIDPSFWANGSYARSEPIISETTTAYSTPYPTGGLKVGVATGTWTTVAAQKVDIKELPPLTEEHRRDRQTGIGMSLGDIPKFWEEATNNKPLDLLPHPDTEEARRFVAVLKSGKVQVLTAGAGAVKEWKCSTSPPATGRVERSTTTSLPAT